MICKKIFIILRGISNLQPYPKFITINILMATTNPSPQPGSRDINFKALLNEKLRSFQKDFKTQEKSSAKTLKDLTGTKEHDKNDQSSWEAFVKDDLNTYQTLQVINENALTTNLTAQNALALATTALANASATATNTATAAKALDKANFSVARMTSDVASIFAKLNSEDKGSELAVLCKYAYELTQDAAEKAEVATMSVLYATIEAAKSHAQGVFDAITEAATDSTKLANAVANDTDAAQNIAIATYKTNLEKIKASANVNLSVTNEDAQHNMLKLISGEGDFEFLYEHLYNRGTTKNLPTGEREKEAVQKEISESKAAEADALKN